MEQLVTIIRETLSDDGCLISLKVEKLIRCKDCKHSEHWYRDKRRCFLWCEDGIDVFEDGFCNYAERRQDEQVDV